MANWRKILRPGPVVQDLGTTDLDQATTPGVEYAQAANVNATPERHYPVPEAGNCQALPYSSANPDRVIQQYTTWASLRLFHRSRFNGVWGDWKEVGS